MKNLIEVFCSTIILFFMFSDINAQSPLDWQIRGNSNVAIKEGLKYGLFCISENDYLKAERRDWGVNLVWKTNNPMNVSFERETGDGQIKSGERIAIFLTGEKGGYLYYKKMDHGINLEFSKTPKYEWEIRNQDNKDGNSIKINSSAAIFSSVEKDFLRGCKRGKPVINLAWSKDCVCISGDCVRKPVSNSFIVALEKMAKKTTPLIL